MIEVLGPLQVRGDGGVVDVGSPRHREVLAALVVDVGRVVSSDALLERVWGDARRGASTSNLHAVISRLRGRLEAAGDGVRIATASPGYRLEADGAVDALVFADLLARARSSSSAGDLAAAHADLEQALALWRGPAYGDISLPFAEVEAARLEGQRLAACELMVDVELGLGKTGAALERLPALVGEQPLREAFRRQQMLALYRSGRQAEALEVFAQVRELLADELGIDPAPPLQELHQRILEQDEDLLATPAEAPATTPRPGVAADHPQPAASPWHSDVVVPADDLVGREHDVEYLRDLLTASPQRLVTVTGVGGVGKTRLAYAVAQASREAFPDGVMIVSLVPLADPDLVLPAIGRAAGLSAVEGLDPLDAVVQQLRTRRVLLVLDNFEHVLGASASLARLVALCPRLTVLATSRTSLQVRGELHYQLAPLALPGTEDADPGVVSDSAAAALFVERAGLVEPGFALDDTNAAAVAGICRRLAGIPLALELAAARAHLLRPADILERIDQVMAASGARDLPARQRTMRAALDWSYQLLEPDEQRLFRLLAVFADGFTLDAVEAVQTAAFPDEHLDVFGLLESLVAHSLVLRDHDNPEVVRFRMLEPVSQFAASCLVGDEERAVRNAHLQHFLELAEESATSYRSMGSTRAALAVTQREHANHVAAAEWALDAGEGDLAGRMVWAMWLYWWLRGHLIVGRRLTQGCLDLDPSGPVAVRAHAVMGAMAFAQGDTVLARHWCRGATLGRSIGDQEGEAHNVAGEGLIALAEDHLVEAEERFVATIELCESVDLAGEWLWTLAHVWLGTVRLLQGSPEAAVPLLEGALEAARRRDDPPGIYIALFTSVQVALSLGDVATARTQLHEGVGLSLETGDMANLAYFLEALAVVESQEGRHEHVLMLHGAAGRLRETVGANIYGYYQPDEQLLADALDGARAELGPSYDDVVARGRALSLEDVITLATGQSQA